MMNDLTVVFRSASDIEARVVRGLLESHGIESLVSQGSPRSIFPVQVDGIAEIRISVRPEDADEARRLIDSHRIDPTDGRVIPLRNEFAALEQRIGYTFRDPGLLEHALTHTSRANEDVSGGVIDNESLEFLGDAVLGFAIADVLFRRFPDRDEGWKSKMKAALVSTASLARLAEGLDLGQHLLLGRGEEKTGGRRKQALLADGYEALIAAIYLDGGVEHGHGVHRAPVRGAHRRGAHAGGRRSTITSRRCRSACSRPAIRRRSMRSSARPGPIITRCFRSRCAWAESRWPRRRAKQEGSGAGSRAAGAGAEDLESTDLKIPDFRSIDFDDAPRLAVVVGELAFAAAGHHHRRLRQRQPRERVRLHFARDVFVDGHDGLQ